MVDADGAGRLLDTLLAPFRAYCVYAAVELGIPDRLTARPVDSGQLADELDVDADSLRRLLRMLASLRIVESAGGDAYRAGELGPLLRTGESNSMRGLAVCYAEQFYTPFRRIVSCIRGGRQGFADVFGAPLFEYYARNPREGHVFDQAMAAGSAFFRGVPALRGFPDAGRVVDVGGGDGSLLAECLRASPRLHGTLAEMPRLLDPARRRLAERGVADRCTFVGCDLFDEVPAGGDVYVLSRVLHDWDDTHCRRVLAVVRAAMRADSRLLVLERVVPDDPTAPSFALDFDVHMLVNTGGRERNAAEYEALVTSAGLQWTDTADLPLGMHALTITRDDT